MRETHAVAASLQQLIKAMRPTMEIIPLNETIEAKEQRIGDRLKALISVYNRFLDLIESWRPFYSDDLYRAYQLCIKATHCEIAQVRLDDYNRRDWYLNAEENQESYARAYKEVLSVIRQRMQEIDVV